MTRAHTWGRRFTASLLLVALLSAMPATGAQATDMGVAGVAGVERASVATTNVALPTGITMFREDQIFRLYLAAFNRQPDAAGLAYWITTWQTVPQIAELFLASSEGLDRYGNLSGREFVELLHLTALGRAGDSAGIAYWVGVVGMMNDLAVELGLDPRTYGHGFVLTHFANSDELIRRRGGNPAAPNSMDWADQIHRLYEAWFLSPPDPAGFAYWLNSGLTPGHIAEQFFMADSTHYGTTETMTDLELEPSHIAVVGQFVNELYWNVLGRLPDADGWSYWVNQLWTGSNFGTVLLAFANSYEFTVRVSTA